MAPFLAPFFLDSAAAGEIRAALQLPWCGGVTTNPVLVAQALGKSPDMAEYLTALQELLKIGTLPFFAQVPEGTPAAMAERAVQLRALAPERVVLKVPCTPDGLSLTAHLVRDGAQVAVTAVFSTTQALLAAAAGAQWAAPYCHRLTAAGGDGVQAVAQMQRALRERGAATRLLVASIKTASEIEQLLAAGADSLTLPLPLLRALADHPLTADARTHFAAAVRT